MTSDFRADLHCHTICSDGSDSPLRLLQLAKEAHLQAVSITDHDTTKAYTQELFKEAEKLGIQLISGVEISSELDGVSVHILGYGFDLEDQGFQEFLSFINVRRKERNQLILKKLEKQNMIITEEELFQFASNRTVGRPHIAELMVQKGYVSDLRQAFERYLKEGASCYAPGARYSPGKVIHEVQKAKGKAILAHPHFYKKGGFLRRLLDHPFDGYECYYARLDKVYELPWVEKARARNLIATGGSDYHGKVKPHISIGSSWVGLTTFKQLARSHGYSDENVK